MRKWQEHFDSSWRKHTCTFAVRGVPPEIMSIGPKKAIPAALRAAGLKQEQMDWIELIE
ncbi:Hypothetical protein HEAR2834 [Herminiimonas arsenicoxydans]|uniref:Thiolase C-terminal domain-containing protein n=1 Tax=Herminiimonas arsenicoxydans TaxID=204773 RepID=A4G8W1_HERAR|nr:Hypothetical protein HEAR2834 [Herminiimonas arsenicoxydans]